MFRRFGQNFDQKKDDRNPLQEARERKWIKRSIRFLGLVVVFAASAFFVNTLVSNFAVIDWARMSHKIWAPVLISSVVCSLALAVNGVAWTGLIRSMGERLSYRVGTGIFLFSQIGKYIPGNVAHHVGRVVAAKKYGASAVVITESIVLDLGAAFLVACWIAVLGAGPWLHSEIFGESSISALAFRGGSIAVLVVGSSISVLVLLRDRQSTTADTYRQRVVALVGVVLGYLIAFLGVGLALWLLVWGVTGRLEELVWVVVVFSVAWVTGLVTPGASGGIGVREALITAGLAPTIGEGAAALVALVFRGVTLSGDGVALAVGYILLNGQKVISGRTE